MKRENGYYWVKYYDIWIILPHGFNGWVLGGVCYGDEKFQEIDENRISRDKPTNSTGSKTGTQHWFYTILSKHKRIGEFLIKSTPSEDILRNWGKELYETSDELIKGINFENNIKI